MEQWSLGCLRTLAAVLSRERRRRDCKTWFRLRQVIATLSH
jgi:hypothetical protein